MLMLRGKIWEKETFLFVLRFPSFIGFVSSIFHILTASIIAVKFDVSWFPIFSCVVLESIWHIFSNASSFKTDSLSVCCVYTITSSIDKLSFSYQDSNVAGVICLHSSSDLMY